MSYDKQQTIEEENQYRQHLETVIKKINLFMKTLPWKQDLHLTITQICKQEKNMNRKLTYKIQTSSLKKVQK